MTPPSASEPPDPDMPFRIAVLGDFSGRASRGICQPESLADRRLRPVDRDNVEELLGTLHLGLSLPMPGRQTLSLEFRELDDFQPDRIFEHVEAFAALRQLRRKLHNPQTFVEAAAEVRGWCKARVAAVEPPPVSQPAQETPPQPVPEGLFNQVLEAQQQAPEESGARGSAPLAPKSQWDALIAELIEPYLLPKTDPKQAEYIASVDATVAELMRQVLHHPQFQALEAAWRALNLLVSRLETGADLKLFLWDVSKAELEADLFAAEDLTRSAIYRVLVEQSVHVPEGKPWSLFVGDYVFGPTRADAELVGRLAKIAQSAGAPLVAGADARLAGCESVARTPDPLDWQFVLEKEAARAWASVCALPEAPWIGLGMPRFLLRLPYGSRTNPIEKFVFEELPGEPDHEGYLWGNPGFACACLLGQSFTAHGWDFRPGMINEIDDLPVHVYKSEGESVLKPCAEALLTDRAAEAIAARGIIPLRSVQNEGAVRVEAFLSLAEPSTRLRGRWK